MKFKNTADNIAEAAEVFHSMTQGGGDGYKTADFLSANPGMGKTYAALSYCDKYRDSLYFSFRHIDASFAPKAFSMRYRDIFKECSDWHTFFECLSVYGKEKRPTVFFDNAGERNDKDEFYAELNSFLDRNAAYDVFFVFLGRPWEQIDVPYKQLDLRTYSPQELPEVLSVKNTDAVKIYYFTSDISSILFAYNKSASFAENVKAMLNTSSPFYRVMENWMNDCFRTPESYNTLLYAMVNGSNRVNELAAFTGYPKNKCDKYLKALAEHSLICRESDKNGHTRYYPANSYVSLWYKAFFTAVPNADGAFGEDVYQGLMKHLNSETLPEFYKELCDYWVEKNINLNSYDYIDTENPDYHNIEVDGIPFGFVFRKQRSVYVYYDTVIGEGLNKSLWQRIDKATTKESPFYNNEYVFCTVNRVPDSYWKLSKTYDNMQIVKIESLLAEYNKEYNRKAHPRFVPSFVNYR